MPGTSPGMTSFAIKVPHIKVPPVISEEKIHVG
jgi:hypothetical protein